MNILVTGLNGFIGRYLFDPLLEQGHIITALLRPYTVKQETFWPAEVTERIVDLSHPFELLERHDVVIHIAASVLSPKHDTQTYISNNIEGTRHLINAVKATGTERFIFFSSLSVYGEVEVPEVNESTEIRNPGAYDISKYMGELMLKDCASSFPSVAMRIPGVVGHNATFGPWLSRVVESAAQNKDIVIYNPEAEFNLALHVEDVVNAVLLLLEAPLTGFTPLNLAAGRGMTVRETAQTICRKLNSNSRIKELPGPRPPFVMSTSLAENQFGFKAPTLHSILDRYLAGIINS